MAEKQWKKIKHPLLKDKYMVSNEGKIKNNTTGNILKCSSLRGGYKSFHVIFDDKPGKSFKVHQMVARTFIPNPDKKSCVNHKDGDKLNNHVDNLEWMTHAENNKHAYDNGLNHLTTRKVQQLDLDENFIKEFDTLCGAGKETGVDAGGIAKVCKGTRQTAGGFKWKFSVVNENENPDADLSKFVDIIDFPNYKINKKGDVYSISFKKFLKQQTTADGYKSITLVNNNVKKSFLMHRLIAEYFVKNDNKEEYNTVHHIDKDKTNNHYKNLKWC